MHVLLIVLSLLVAGLSPLHVSAADKDSQLPAAETTGNPPPPQDLSEAVPEAPQMVPPADEESIISFFNDKSKRVILKKHSFEIAPFIGPFLGDALPNSIIYGARTSFFVTENFAVGVDGGFTKSGVEPFTFGTVTTQGSQGSYFVVGNLYYHFPMVFRRVFSKSHILQADLFMDAGAGIFHTLETKPTFNIGGGVKAYWNPFIVLRIDVRNFLIPANPPVVPKDRITSNAVMMFGVSFFLPTRIPGKPQTAFTFMPAS